MKAPKYIIHQGREMICVRSHRGTRLLERKVRVADRLADKQLRRWHRPLQLCLQLQQARPGFIVGRFRTYFRF